MCTLLHSWKGEGLSGGWILHSGTLSSDERLCWTFCYLFFCRPFLFKWTFDSSYHPAGATGWTTPEEPGLHSTWEAWPFYIISVIKHCYISAGRWFSNSYYKLFELFDYMKFQPRARPSNVQLNSTSSSAYLTETLLLLLNSCETLENNHLTTLSTKPIKLNPIRLKCLMVWKIWYNIWICSYNKRVSQFIFIFLNIHFLNFHAINDPYSSTQYVLHYETCSGSLRCYGAMSKQ